MKGVLYGLTILLSLYSGLLMTRFCCSAVLSLKKVKGSGLALSFFFALFFLAGALFNIYQLYRVSFLLAIVTLIISAHDKRTENLFWFVMFYCITVLLVDIAILALPGLVNMRANAPGASELKVMLEALALAISLTISFCFVTSQRKNCDCDFRSFVILILIVILMTAITDTGFIIFANTLADYTPFVVIAAVAALIVFLSILLCKRLSMYNRQVRELERQHLILSNMENRVQEMDQFYELVSSLRHDINQQMSVAEVLDIQGNSAERIAFLQELNASLPAVFDTGIPALDALLSLKSYECEKADIRFESQLCDLHEHPMTVTGITSVLSNLLNNALEAQRSDESKDKDKYIRLVVKRTRNVLFIECINPIFRDIQKDGGGRFISTKTEGSHGYGIENIKSIIEQTGGECAFNIREGRFIAEIFIPFAIEGTY